MAKGVSIHVGVNKVDAPGINVPDLEGCVNDAARMKGIAEGAGFSDTQLFIDGDATYQVVFNAIDEASTKVVDDDIFLFTFSGHGTRQSALQEGDEEDSKDETIVLHDRVMIDDVFNKVLWPKFPQNVRILTICDSCHSGSALFDSLMAHGFLNVEGIGPPSLAGVGASDLLAAVVRATG